jgi:hypothetical protein
MRNAVVREGSLFLFIKQIENNNQFTKELKKSLIKGSYCSIQDYLNEGFSTIGY